VTTGAAGSIEARSSRTTAGSAATAGSAVGVLDAAPERERSLRPRAGRSATAEAAAAAFGSAELSPDPPCLS
jgi:hypothetical protein